MSDVLTDAATISNQPKVKPAPKKFCCDVMADAWRAGVTGWSMGGVGLRWQEDAGDSTHVLMETIFFCPWCGFRFKTKPTTGG